MKLVPVVFILLAAVVTHCLSLVLPLDCSDIYNHDKSRRSGVYTIYPIGATSAVQVYCDMDSLDGRWTVFQRRMDGTVNFYRPWDHYKFGFGNAAGEYWLGLENLFHLTLRKKYELLVNMEDFSGNKVFARYSSFSINPESDGYRLNVSGFTDGGAGEDTKSLQFQLQIHIRSLIITFVRRNLTMKLVPVVFLLLAPLLTSCTDLIKPVDCSDIRQRDKSSFSGVFTIYPLGERSAVQVYCDMDSLGGGWTVIQRRMDGSVNFYRPWNYYKFGFGDAAGEYWLGLDNIHYLTNQRKYELLVDMQDFDGNQVFARYTSFSVSGECEGYTLSVSGFIDGGAGDGLGGHSGHKFSTFDKDQDTWPNNCAKSFLGAFWYTACHSANPNGVYRWGADGTLYAVGVSWSQWKGVDYSVKSISMKIHPVQ